MQIIQIARGEIAAREAQSKLYAGELFLNKVDNSTFELYVGTDSVGNKIKIGGNGGLAPTDSITELPAQPLDGAFYLVETDIQGTSSDPNFPQFRAGDYAFWSTKLGNVSGEWYRINNGGGTADETSYTAGERDTSAGILYKDTDTTENIIKDTSINTVKGALDQLFKTKADLDHNGKLPLRQLPDTIIGAMECQGTYTLASSVTEFTVPTVANKSSDDDDTTTNEADTSLVKGDYWVYSGPRLAVSDPVSSSDGYINSGDYIVYNGNNTWGVIDNTSPILGIKGQIAANSSDDDTISQADAALQGEVTITGENRTGTLVEIQTVVDDTTGPTLKIEAPNAALINEDTIDTNVIYKEGGNKTLVKSGLSEANDTLNINEPNGISVSGAVDTSDNVLPATAIVQNPGTTLGTGETTNITVTLPAQSGTLATEESLGSIVAGDGEEFFIPSYVSDNNGGLKLAKSPIEIIDDYPDDGSEGFVFHHKDDNNEEHTSTVLFQKGDGNNKEVVHAMPYVSGTILNTNSIIDCGEWKVVDGNVVVTAENEGTFDLGLPTGTDEATYETALKNKALGPAAQEEIVAVITD